MQLIQKLNDFYIRSRLLMAFVGIPLLLLAVFLTDASFYAIWTLVWYYMNTEISYVIDLSPSIRDHMLFFGSLLLTLTIGLSSLPFFSFYLPLFLWLLFPLSIFSILSIKQKTPFPSAVLYLLYITLPIFFLFFIYQKQGPYAVLLLLLSCWLMDTLSYFTGILFGRHPVAPKLSPKKTIEGALGGIIGTMLLFPFLLRLLPLSLKGMNPYGIGLLLTISAFTGDLFESYIKRFYQKKDSGTILKGHGGMLDRFDSFLFVAFAYFTLFVP